MMLALTLRPRRLPKHVPFDNWLYTTDNYMRIFDPLGVPLIPVYSQSQLEAVERLCSGLIVTGNIHDVPPHYYGEEPLEGLHYDYDDYAFDDFAIQRFARAGKAILGICAGLQSINVSFGGSLYQRIQGHYLENGEKHSASFAPGSFLAGIYGGRAQVNSFHNQAAKRVADGFTVTASAGDGTVEAIERGNIIGVQWHPETEPELPLFRAFLSLAGS